MHEGRKMRAWRNVGFFLIIRQLGESKDILGLLVHPQGMGISIYDLERMSLTRICYWYQRYTEISKSIKDDIDKAANKNSK